MTEISKGLTFGGIGIAIGGLGSAIYGGKKLVETLRGDPQEASMQLIANISYCITGIAAIAFGGMMSYHGQLEPNNYLHATTRDISHINYLFDRA